MDKGSIVAKRTNQAKELPRAAVENIASIYGKRSSAARALEEADAYDGPVQFFQEKLLICLDDISLLKHLHHLQLYLIILLF